MLAVAAAMFSVDTEFEVALLLLLAVFVDVDVATLLCLLTSLPALLSSFLACCTPTSDAFLCCPWP